MSEWIECKVYYKANRNKVTIPVKALGDEAMIEWINDLRLTTKDEIVYRNRYHPEVTKIKDNK